MKQEQRRRSRKRQRGGTLRLNLTCCRFLGGTESRRFAPDIALLPNYLTIFNGQ